MQTRQVNIATRFCGPPDSGNGGYSVGLLAREFDYKAEVTLRVPPPLEHAMTIVREGDMARMLAHINDEEIVVGEAVATVLEGEAPAFVNTDTARHAAKSFRGFDDHIFPTCFVCGPDREEGDGLRIFPGSSSGLVTGLRADEGPADDGPADDGPADDGPADDVVAAPWHVDASLDGGDGYAHPLFVAAALDCPGYFASVSSEKALLGRMSLDISGVALPVGEDAVVVARKDAEEGRKRFASTAVYTDDGRLVGWSRQIWIVIPQ